MGPKVCFILPGPMCEDGGHHKDSRGNIVALRGVCRKIGVGRWPNIPGGHRFYFIFLTFYFILEYSPLAML